MYDSSKKFVLLKSPPTKLKFNNKNSAKATTIGNKIIIFQHDMKMAGIYDINEDKWSAEEYKSKDSYKITDLVKIPQ